MRRLVRLLDHIVLVDVELMRIWQLLSTTRRTGKSRTRSQPSSQTAPSCALPVRPQRICGPPCISYSPSTLRSLAHDHWIRPYMRARRRPNRRVRHAREPVRGVRGHLPQHVRPLVHHAQRHQDGGEGEGGGVRVIALADTRGVRWLCLILDRDA